jgi:DNA modification methylase
MDEEDEVLTTLMNKWKRFNEQTRKMVAILKQYGLSNQDVRESMVRTMGVERAEVKGTNYTIYNNDCVEEIKNMPENSIDLIVTSIPFSNHYEYTPSYNDFGHNDDNDKFFEQMDYLTPEALRVLKPGRVACIHVKDRILFGNATGDGMPTVDPFSDLTVMHYMKHGFKYMGRITITTDVVRENNQTYRLGWTEQCKDGSKMGVGCPEYVLLFRKLPTDKSTAYADTPVVKSKEEYSRGKWQIDAHAYWRSSGNVLLGKEAVKSMPVDALQRVYREFSLNNVYDYKEHIETVERLDKDNKLPATFMVCAPASWNESVWDDIVRMRTLNSEQSRRRQQMHVCPLQLDIVERLINRYSNKGDKVLDFFGGIMTVPYLAVKMERYGIGIELNSDYFRDGLAYCKQADLEKSTPTLFDFLGEGA